MFYSSISILVMSRVQVTYSIVNQNLCKWRNVPACNQPEAVCSITYCLASLLYVSFGRSATMYILALIWIIGHPSKALMPSGSLKTI
jgi:hypothetical protein